MKPAITGPRQENKRKSMARTYNQDCILAHALDLLGERWTLLILRDLFLGPADLAIYRPACPDWARISSPNG